MSLCDHKLSKGISQPGGSIQENISKQGMFQHIEIADVWFIVFSNILVSGG